MILVFGSINVDLVTRVDEIPRPGETVLSPGAETFFGGKGANQAVAAAAVGATKVVMAGAIGSDGFGRDCAENFARRGVDVSALQTVEGATGMAFIAVDRRGENAITVASGANLHLLAEALPATVFEGLGLCVLQMEVPAAQSLAAAERAKAAGARVILNLAPAPADLPRESLEALLEVSDILVVNAHEAEVVAKLAPGGASDAAGVAARYGLDLVQTLGGDGLRLYRANATEVDLPAAPVEVVDTTGAGDTFVGALAGHLAQGADLEAALRAAAAAASKACTWAGAQPKLSQ